MKILVISQHFPPEKSGNASRIFDMCSHLQKMGEYVTVLAPHPSFPPSSFKRKWSVFESRKMNDVNIINLLAWQPKSQDPGFVGRMAYYLSFPLHAVIWIFFNFRKFDVIITSAPPIFTGIGGIPAKLIFKKKWVMDVRDLWINASISLGFLKKGSLFEKMSRVYEQFCYSSASFDLRYY
ncbi:glycosyltransferase family protein [Methanosarcina mazei]|uniref:glycosyl transferase n=1 Tax=Methanosarcina mazei TaxID=2209 RepID=UPI00064FF5C4|nr:glycosyl transferase [Methanosarcina mazei]